MASNISKYVLFGLLVLCALSSLAAMLGDINAYQAKRLEQRWVKSSATLTFAQWQTARRYLHNALVLSPGHPDYLQSVGRLSSWRFFIQGAASTADAQAGLTAFRQALVARPYWAYGWSELVLLKAQVGELDAEFTQALTNALKVGPNEYKVQLNLLNAGLGVWGQLSWSDRARVQALFAPLLKSPWRLSRPALDMAQEHGMKAAVCYTVSKSQVSHLVAKRCEL